MHAQTKIGGANRAGLLRVWFLFYLWVCVPGIATFQPSWEALPFMFGTAFTLLLIYRGSRLSGIVGFLVVGSAFAMTLMNQLWFWTALLAGRLLSAGTFYGLDLGLFGPALNRALFLFVPAAVLWRHVSARHRIMQAFEDHAPPRGAATRSSGYYLITLR